MRIRVKSAAVAVFSAVALGTFGLAAPAHAGTKWSDCGGQLLFENYCLFYNSYQSGGQWPVNPGESYPDWGACGGPGLPCNFSDLGTGTAGVNQSVKNNAASYTNTSYSKTGVSYYNSYYAGASDWGAPRTYNGLVQTYNENASFRWA